MRCRFILALLMLGLLSCNIVIADFEQITMIKYELYKEGDVNITSLEVTRGTINHQPSKVQDGFHFSILDSESQELFHSSIHINFETHEDRIVPCEYDKSQECIVAIPVYFDKKEGLVRIPFYKSAKTLNFYYGEDLKQSLDLKEYICDKEVLYEVDAVFCEVSLYCGNGVCDGPENEENCPLDCKVTKKKVNIVPFIITILIIALIGIVLFVVIKKKRAR